MGRRTTGTAIAPEAFDKAGATITPTPLPEELSGSFLEYAYSVIHSRALPDAKDGLKPVHRRILFHMGHAGLRPDKGHVKSARVVGDVMGRYHPHGDGAIYDALVRMAQDFSMSVPLVDGHGNFGTPDDSPAAARYTEARLSPVALTLVDELNEGTVDWEPNYDGTLQQPVVLPAGYPNLLVNGAEGLAVGMATKMVPHNLSEVCQAAKYLVLNPGATLRKLRSFVPGPDLPTGGQIIGMDGINDAYMTGRGKFRIRASVQVGPAERSRGRQAITVTGLPYQVGPEQVIEKIKEEIGKKRLAGVADVKDLSDRNNGMRLVIECKAGVNPEALLAELYRLTPLETTFAVNNLALVDGEPRTLGLKDLLQVWVDHRLDVVTRRTRHRLDRATERAHIVEGLLVALDNIDEVVKLIRASKTSEDARVGLVKRFALTDVQAGHILDMTLRRLTALEVDRLRNELAELRERIAALQAILDDEQLRRRVVADELATVSKTHGTPRRTVLVEGALAEVVEQTQAAAAEVPLEVGDDPVTVFLSATGLLGRTAAGSETTGEGSTPRSRGGRVPHDVIVGSCPGSARGQVLLVTNKGRALRVDVLTLPVVSPTGDGLVGLRGGMPAVEAAGLESGERAVTVIPGSSDTPGVGVALGTRAGVVKVCTPDWPVRGEDFPVIALKDRDEVVGGAWLPTEDADLVLVASDASLLRFPAGKVRPQGRTAAGMAGIKLGAGVRVVSFNVVPTVPADPLWEPLVVTSTGMTVKVSPFSVFPVKGRATGGVRAHRFLSGEDRVDAAFVGVRPVAAGERGDPARLPEVNPRRDGSGSETGSRPVLMGSQVVLPVT